MTTFIVNGQEKELHYIFDGIDITDDFIGNTSHGMAHDEEGRYIADQDDYEWWQNTIEAHQEMDAAIEAYKATNNPDEVDRVVQDWIRGVDLDMQPAQVALGLRQSFGIL